MAADTVVDSACVFSSLRTYYTWKFSESPDISYNIVPVGMCAYAEVSTGLVISCLPVMPRFFQHICPKVSKSLHSGSLSFKKTSTSDFSKAYQASVSRKREMSPVTIPFNLDRQHQHSSPQGEYIILHDVLKKGVSASADEVLQLSPKLQSNTG